jgi:O-antigen/teichoic acid export membrane protein
MKKSITIIFFANAFTLLSGVITSLLTAWALGPEGRGDLAVVVLWPNVVALLVGMGLPQAHRYYLAREPETFSALFSNALLFTLGMGAVAYAAAEFVVPNLVGVRSAAVMWLVRIYLLNIPLALLYDLMAGFLEGAREFKCAALARVIFFGIQSGAYLALWLSGHLTVESATFTMIGAQCINSLTALIGVLYVLRPRWQPGWAAWKLALGYGLRYHPGVVTAFTTLRLDQLMLGGMASSVEIGLYFIAVRLSEITTVLASSVADVLMPVVAASKEVEESVQLLTRSLRQTIYVYVLALIPLLLGAPWILHLAYGAEFLAATGTLRLLLIASLIWSAGAIVISGLNGLGYPGLSTLARLASAIVTVFALLYWLPRHGIVGAAFASLLGYGVMLIVALFWLVRKQRLSLWDCLRPQRDDLPLGRLLAHFRLRFN